MQESALPVDETRPDPEAMIWSARMPSAAGRPLVIMMHGYGGVEGDMTPCFAAVPPGAVAVSVRGPVAVRDRWAWHDRYRQPQSQFDAAARALLAWIETLPGRPRIGLLGFSQGGAMAIQLMRHAPHRFVCAVHLSAFVMPGALPTDPELAEVRPPVLSAHGGLDDVIPPADPLRQLGWLRRHTTLTERAYPQLGHTISTDVVQDAAPFLAEHLGTC